MHICVRICYDGAKEGRDEALNIQKLVGRLRDMNMFSRVAFRAGAILMTAFYILAVAARLIAPQSEDYFELMSIFRGSLEAAPACLAVGVGIALIGDLVLHRDEK